MMPLAAIFPGQGSQFAGMADPWTTHEAGREVLEEASSTMERDLVADCHDEDALQTTDFVQPALLACDVAAFRVLEAEGAHVGAAAGHSLGEFAALVAAEVIDLAPALEIVVVRARAMQDASLARPGTMTALLGISPAGAAEICEEGGRGDVLTVANENSSNQVVLSGTVTAIERAEDLARGRGAKVIRLKVAGAFHSSLMQPALEPIRQALEKVEFREPRFPIVANVSGRIVENPSTLRDLLARHVVSPVLWERSMIALSEAGFDTFVEAGPGRVLSKLVTRSVPGASASAVGSPADATQLVRSLSEEEGS